MRKFKLRNLVAIAVYTVLAVVLTGCQFSGESNVKDIKENLVYFKDEKTNLCFAAINSTNTSSLTETTSITCVPCDSLKNVTLK